MIVLFFLIAIPLAFVAARAISTAAEKNSRRIPNYRLNAHKRTVDINAKRWAR